jgi:hypothetical protein
VLNEDDFEILAQVIEARREEHGFLLTAWVFLPDHWRAILGPRYPKGLSLVMESVKVSSTRQINAQRGELGRLWQGRFFDPAPRDHPLLPSSLRRGMAVVGGNTAIRCGGEWSSGRKIGSGRAFMNTRSRQCRRRGTSRRCGLTA